MRLTDAQRVAVWAGRPSMWLGTRECGAAGNTMQALERKGLAETRWSHPHRLHGGRMLYRLTPAGNALRVEWALEEATRPPAHEPIRVRCTFCGAEFPDGTPGGSCGRCGQAVEQITTETED